MHKALPVFETIFNKTFPEVFKFPRRSNFGAYELKFHSVQQKFGVRYTADEGFFTNKKKKAFASARLFFSLQDNGGMFIRA